MRKAAVAATVVLLVLTIAVLLAPRLVSLDSLKPRIIAALEEKTGRQITLSGLSLSLFPGIGLKIVGLEVSGDPPDSDEPLLSVPEGEVRVAIGPLFSGKAEFTKLILHRPQIHFHKYRDGTHSATDIANRLAKPDPAARAASPDPGEGEKIGIILKTVSIEDGTLSLRIEEQDGRETRWDISPFGFRLSGIGENRNDFELRTRIEGAVRGEIAFAGISVHEVGRVVNPTVFDLTGEGNVFGQRVTAEGKMSAPYTGPTEVDLAIAFPRVEMDRIPGIFPDPPPALAKARLEGLGSLSLKVFGTLQSMGVEAEADLTRAGWTVSENPEIRKYIDIPCTMVAQGHYFPDRVVVSNAELRFPPLLLIANAVIDPATGAREWSASSRIASLAEFSKARGGGLSAWSPAGRVTASGKGRRDRDGGEERYEVAVDLGEVGVKVPDRRIELRAIEGHVDLTPEAVAFSPLAGLLNGQRFLLRGNAALGARPTGHVDIRMAYLDLDALFPPDGGGARKDGKASRPKKETTPAKQRKEVSGRASLSIDAGVARGVEFRDLKGKIRYRDGTLFLDSASARMYGGDVDVTGHIGLQALSPDFRMKVAARNVAVEEILSRKTSLADFLSGPVSLSAEIEGGMKDFDDFTRSAKGMGSVRISGGKIKGVDLFATAAGLAGLEAFAPPVSSSPGTAARGETRFSDFSADFQVGNRMIRTESLRILSEKVGLDGKAAVGFDRTIDFQGALRLSGEISQRVRGGAGKFLVGEDGRVEVPLVMSGPLTSPAVAIDPTALARGAGKKFLRGLTERIPGGSSSSGADNAAPAKGPERADPLKDVEGLFRKVFPGKQR